MFQKILSFSVVLIYFKLSLAATWVMPPAGNIVGEIQYTDSEPGETLSEVGLRYDMGYHEMLVANPRIDSVNPLPSGSRVLIPSRFTLPQVPRQGLVIDLARYRLYFFPPGENVVMTYPVGIGRKGWDTPLGVTKIVSKQRNPDWRPSAKLQAEAAKHGVLMPDFFPAGPANPLGKRVMRLGWPSYLIHGSNHRNSIGTRSSAGCIRMLPEDIDYLFEHVKVGTIVRVVNRS